MNDRTSAATLFETSEAHQAQTSSPYPPRTEDHPDATRLQGFRPERGRPTTQAILTLMFGPVAERQFNVRYWDGTVDRSGDGDPRFTLILRSPHTLRRVLWSWSSKDLSAGEAYLRDDFDVDGDLEALTSLSDSVTSRLKRPGVLAQLALLMLTLPAVTEQVRGENSQAQRATADATHSRAQDAGAIRYHYDVGNDFYALWLDESMAYSCAYYPTGTEDLAAAQVAKFELICRKLRLQQGESLLYIGCGWGGLALYAARQYGTRVTGVTLSESQAVFAQERAAAAGLPERVKIEVRDYRDLPASAVYDKIVSVGMFEHVGRANLPLYFAQAYRLLRPGGLFLNHGIVSALPPTIFQTTLERISASAGRRSFIQTYVFPNGELLPLSEVLTFAEKERFETRDVENLREHYAHTLRDWVRRLEARHGEAKSLVGEQMYRIWRLYMSGSASAFASGQIGVSQMLLAKPDLDGAVRLPPSRADLYATKSLVGRT
jgi:cyclopropane-fatty-acyl-phospholipid synthase